ADRDSVTLARMLGRRVDGLILATARRKDPTIERCAAEEIPLVLINRTVKSSARLASVVNDDAAGIRLTVAHLAGLRPKRIAHIAGPQDLSTGLARQRGLETAMKELGLKLDPALIVHADAYSQRAGQRWLTT